MTKNAQGTEKVTGLSGMSAGVGRKVLHPKGESETTMRAITEYAVTPL